MNQPSVRLYALVAAGAVCGGLLRYLMAVGGLLASDFDLPVATLMANAMGSFVVGWLHGRIITARLRLDESARVALMAGFCGSLTTFSIFSFECLLLWQAGQPGLAGIYVLLSVVVWMAAVALGFGLGRGSRALPSA